MISFWSRNYVKVWSKFSTKFRRCSDVAGTLDICHNLWPISMLQWRQNYFEVWSNFLTNFRRRSYATTTFNFTVIHDQFSTLQWRRVGDVTIKIWRRIEVDNNFMSPLGTKVWKFISYAMLVPEVKHFASAGHSVRQSALRAGHSQFVSVFCICCTIEIWKSAGHYDRILSVTREIAPDSDRWPAVISCTEILDLTFNKMCLFSNQTLIFTWKATLKSRWRGVITTFKVILMQLLKRYFF